jgi:hypothetical protein
MYFQSPPQMPSFLCRHSLVLLEKHFLTVGAPVKRHVPSKVCGVVSQIRATVCLHRRTKKASESYQMCHDNADSKGLACSHPSLRCCVNTPVFPGSVQNSTSVKMHRIHNALTTTCLYLPHNMAGVSSHEAIDTTVHGHIHLNSGSCADSRLLSYTSLHVGANVHLS